MCFRSRRFINRSARKLRGIYRIAGKGIGAGIRHRKVHSRGLGGAEILIGAGILHLIKGIPEHLIVGFLPVQQEVDGFPDFLIIDLTVKILFFCELK